MADILYAYELVVRPKGGEPQPLGNFDGAGSTLIDQLVTFLQKQQAEGAWLQKDINAAARVRQVTTPTTDEPDVVSAVIEAGEMGLDSTFVRATDEGLSDESEFDRTADHAEMVQVVALAKLPALRERGFLVMHARAGRSLKTRFWEGFTTAFKGRFPDYTLDLNPTFPRDYYKSLIKKRDARKVTLKRLVRPKDMTDEDRRWFEEEQMGEIRTVIATRGRVGRLVKDDILEALDDQKKVNALLVFHNVSYDQIAVTVKDAKGREHSINLEGGHVGRPGWDVSDSIPSGASKEARIAAVKDAAVEYIELLSQGGQPPA